MKIDVFVHFVHPDTILDKLNSIEGKVKQVMATQAQAAAELRTVKDQVTKIGTETQTLLDRIQELIGLVEQAGNVTPELQEAIDGVKAQVAVVDELVPDAPPPPPPEP